MYSEKELDLIKSINFGEVDGYGDPNLDKYFLDNDYWNKIIENNIFYVVGKKGTGKSSIYRTIESKSHELGNIVSNKDFGEFPFEKLLQLSDDDFSAPNQYQSIWQNMILQIFAQIISTVESDDSNIYKQELSQYVETCLGKSVVDLHKKVITQTAKTEQGLIFKGLSSSHAKEYASDFSLQDYEISKVNTKLLDLIINFLKTSNSDIKYIIQFDRLDDNYNQYQDLDKYFQSIISLFKVTYSLNQKFRRYGITNAKVILYVRTDILKEMSKRDTESARWEDFKYEISWKVNNVRDWKNSKLYEMISKRIKASSSTLSNYNFENLFKYTYLTNCKSLFAKILLETLFRPRNLIMFCKILQKYILEYKDLKDATYNAAQKEYSNWLFNSEIVNEISPILQGDLDAVKELLEKCGQTLFSFDHFVNKYNELTKKINKTPSELLIILYDAGVIENCWKDKQSKTWLHKSVFRNEGSFNKDMFINILPCVWRGLTA